MLNMKCIRRSRVRILKIILFVVLVYVFHKLFGAFDGLVKSPNKKRDQRPTLVDGLGNFEPPPEESREGPGEGGQAYHLPEDRKAEGEASIKEYGMNMEVSDEIAWDRTIKDFRHEECRHWNYPYDLPKTSVILAFHNEGLSVIMRTVYSILNRTPEHILHEIILVDDLSDKDDLKETLEDHVEQLNGKVHLYRNAKREGLIRTRARGAEEATGEVIVFLDAHCEVGFNWLPPLLAPIYRDRTIMTVPIVDRIDYATFEHGVIYAPGSDFQGSFEWGMLYKENKIKENIQDMREYKSEPYKSANHAGGLLAINREFFFELGGYDKGLLFWGGENYELSFKIWQCGGSIEWVPCSRVAHVYRPFVPYSTGGLGGPKNKPLHLANYRRVIETWFDDKHKEYFYAREPTARYVDMGDISEQINLKERLKCKNFSWYMENVAYDVFERFPAPPPNAHWGDLVSVPTGSCVDDMQRTIPTALSLFQCNGRVNRLNVAGQLGYGERCIDVEENSDIVKLLVCPYGVVDGPWQYNEKNRTLFHRERNKCLEARIEGFEYRTVLMPCNPKNEYQQWYFRFVPPAWAVIPQ